MRTARTLIVVACLVAGLTIADHARAQGTFSGAAAGRIGGAPVATKKLDRSRYNKNNPPLGVSYNSSVSPGVDVGDIGNLGNVVLLQVVDDGHALVELGNGEGISSRQVVMASIPTKGLADGRGIVINQIYKVTGTSHYTAVSGANRTVLAVEPWTPASKSKVSVGKKSK